MNLYEKFRNLMVMAIADGALSEGEIQFLSERCRRWGMSDHEFAEAIRYALSPEAALTMPPGKAQRREMLQDLVRTMAADGQMSDIEKQLFAIAAAHLDLTEDELNDIIDSVL